MTPGQVDWPGVPHAPLFGLDPAQNEPSRISGPMSAAVMLLGAIPFFLWTPDAVRTGLRTSSIKLLLFRARRRLAAMLREGPR